ncbi:hypothetical protein [Streptomyces sp. NPDC002088]|uniref:hypothetical protein n=1 Tax=Streptomyces sp. NPDC002088 TaxID=3154665 RepID=UPI00331C4CBA
MATYEWQSIADEFLNYLGALSVETPSLDTPEAKAALKDAVEAAAGAVCFAAYYPKCTFQVFLDYVNFGISYDPSDEDDAEENVTAGEWIDAFCLAISCPGTRTGPPRSGRKAVRPAMVCRWCVRCWCLALINIEVV